MGLGPVLGLAIVGLGAPLQNSAERRVLGPWLTVSTGPLRWTGLSAPVRPTLVVTVALLVVVWVSVAVLLSRHALVRGAVLTGVCSWAAPFALAPPFLSRDAYAYLAQGELLRRGLDPYRSAVAALGPHSPMLLAVDPLWRHTIPPYGPLALRLQEICAWAGVGAEWRGLLALRLLVLLCLGLTLVLLRRAVPAARRDLVTWLAASPLVLLHVLGALHLEAVLCLLLVAAAVLTRSGHTAWAAGLAVLAAEVKATALVVVVLLLVGVAAREGLRAAVAPAAGACLSAGIGVLLLPGDPFGWIRGLGTPASGWVPSTPSSTLYLLLSEARLKLRLDAWPPLRDACQDAVMLGGAALLVVLLRHVGQRSLARMSGTMMLVIVVFGPVSWPWYVAPAALLLLLDGQRLSFSICLGAVPSLAALPISTVGAQRTLVAAEITALVALTLARRGRRPAARPRDLLAVSRPGAPADGVAVGR